MTTTESDTHLVPPARPVVRCDHPLGPRFYRMHAPQPRAARIRAAVVAAGCLALLGIAGFLEPDARGYGTHRALGVWPCSFPLTTGYPCPTCGMTTAFAYTVRGHWVRAFNAQPAGWVLCVALMAGAGLAVSVVITGKTWRINWYRVSPTWAALVVVGLLLAGWAYKILAGLIGGTLPAR